MIDRFRTAIKRNKLSVPFKLAFKEGLICKDDTIFDYGCGRGDDVKILKQMGYHADGWDPYYFKDHPLIKSDTVNLGYVVCVIEDRLERATALLRAFHLTKKYLLVSARLGPPPKDLHYEPYKDGVKTSANTFQKFYNHNELQVWVGETLMEFAWKGSRPGFLISRIAPGVVLVQKGS